ncbi:MAG TPA: glycosyltransferase [Thermoanaerobaculia bacterium]|nr:glycosyltransferase [Thermoanaerobaculia bacterium]
MRASVIVPDLDSPWIGETLDGLAAQGRPGEDFEVIVVGRDGPGLVPTDGPGVRLIASDRPLSPAAARNLGVAAARGSSLLFTDADCQPFPGWLSRLTLALERSPVAGGAVTFPHGGNRWALADNIASFHELLSDRPAEPDTKGPLGSLNLAVTRQAWETVGPFDEALPTSEDHDWVLRARAAGLATGFEPAAVVRHAAVRVDRDALVAHARWYGRHFHDFRRRHPDALATGPTWRSRRTLATTAPAKALASALEIFLSHRRELAGCRAAFPGVLLFKHAWYREVLATWPGTEREAGRGDG